MGQFRNARKTLFMKIRHLLFALAVASSCLFASQLAAQSFTLQQVMSAPFSSELSAAPKGQRFVWVSDQQGKRNLWLAESSGDSHYEARALTHYDADDGLEIGDVVWAPDGGSVIYVRGGDFEFPEK